jgi:NAD+--asparagine ADP-ribosyltransferase
MASLRNRLQAAIDNFAAAQATLTQAYTKNEGIIDANTLKDVMAKELSKILDEVFA